MSFVAETSAGAYCTAGPNINAGSFRQCYGQVTAGAGAGSFFEAPIWLRDGADLAEFDTFFEDVGTTTALGRVFSGSISFGSNARPFYTPPRFEVLHEMIHVLDNALGENREKLFMAPGEIAVWTTAEEYWAIDGGTAYSENALYAEYGNQPPARYGHAGLPLDQLATQPHTLRQLSRQP
ncbi:MAG: hypothetical protein ACRDOI_10305 [Trebonia sp.]